VATRAAVDLSATRRFHITAARGLAEAAFSYPDRNVSITMINCLDRKRLLLGITHDKRSIEILKSLEKDGDPDMVQATHSILHTIKNRYGIEF
jgi:hypothetical protein